jgi:integrase
VIAGDSDQVLAPDAVCLLDVPTNKTGTVFTKPVDPFLGQALDAWQAVQPSQPRLLDRRTGESVDLLFAVRARRVSSAYINNTVIPMLCRKAAVPDADVRGNITSHRARSTIASQLYNAKEPHDTVRAASLARPLQPPRPTRPLTQTGLLVVSSEKTKFPVVCPVQELAAPLPLSEWS